ncbi:hypothetical protein [Noviherbaspirillum aerium]|nr:hypothetical protein [Noviherbaspirillum aerium]
MMAFLLLAAARALIAAGLGMALGSMAGLVSGFQVVTLSSD